MNKRLEEIGDECLWSVLSRDENNTTFQDVEPGDKLYGCIKCKEEPDSCRNYRSYKEVDEKYSESK